MEGYTVTPITYDDTKFWIKRMHYAHRMPSISYSFGLFFGKEQKELIGVITYGVSANFRLCTGICGDQYKKIVLELNRVCLLNNKKNEASYLIGNSLKLIPKPKIIVSYADTGMGHIGKIYQATNWLYTGHTAKSSYCTKIGDNKHSRESSVRKENMDKNNNDYKIVERSIKHRYVCFLGSKKQKKQLRKALNYSVVPYPKGDTEQYEIRDEIKNKPRLTPLGF